MDGETKKNFFINICTWICLAFFSIFIVTNMLCSLFQTAYMELYLDTEKPLYKGDSPFLLVILVVAFLGSCMLFLRKKKLTCELCVCLEKVSLIWTAIICSFIILIFRVRVACDSAAVSEIAIDFLNRDFSAFSEDGYIVHYPHQLGLISFLMLGYYLFGKENYLFFQCLNVIAILCTVYYFHRMADILFQDLKVRLFTSLLCMGMLPLFLLSTFIYGDIPGLGLAVMAIYYTLCYFMNDNKKAILPAVLSISLSVILKSNNLIILIAIIILLLLKFIRTNDKYALLLIFVMVLGVKAMNAVVDSYFIHIADLDKLPEGIPKIAWIAMGLQSNDYIENGWYNSYNWNVYSSSNFDSAKTTSICLESIKESVQSFIQAPISAFQFFYKKFISQWNDPSFNSQIVVEWYSRHRDDHSALAKYLIYGKGRMVLESFMNWYHFLVLFGACIFTGFHIRKRSLPLMLLPLCVLGGYLFHLIWEAKGRYGLGYFILCVPMAAWGLSKICELKWRFK